MTDAQPRRTPEASLEQNRRDQLRTTLEQAGGNHSVAAREPGISRATRYRHPARLEADEETVA